MAMIAFFLIFAISSSFCHKLCFVDYGCFDDNEPFNHPLILLPQNPDVIQTKYNLFTRENTDTPQVLDPLDSSSINASFFDARKKTAFVLHGYFPGLGIKFWEKPLIKALLARNDMNVIYVDWSIGAAFPYAQAVGNTRIVAAQLTKLVGIMKSEQPAFHYSSVHCIGFGLGSATCGLLGRNTRRANETIGRISALSPPSLYYDGEHVDRRLDPTDADFVDAIHTDSKTIVVKGLGTELPVGHMDFYPNGGYGQPNCRILGNGITQLFTCGHFRAVEYFIESIDSECPLRGYACPPCPEGEKGCDKYSMYIKGQCNKCPERGCPSMGYNAIQYKGVLNGSFYLKTNGEKPYCAYQYLIRFNTAKKLFADLNGAVNVKLFGSKYVSENIVIPSHEYTSGSSDSTLITTRHDLGSLSRIKVQHEATLDWWFLDSVEIRAFWNNTTYTGCYQKNLNSPDNEVDLHTNEPGYCV